MQAAAGLPVHRFQPPGRAAVGGHFDCRWENQLPGATPCQCLTSGGMLTTSPGRFRPRPGSTPPPGDQQDLAALAVDVPVVAAGGGKGDVGDTHPSVGEHCQIGLPAEMGGKGGVFLPHGEDGAAAQVVQSLFFVHLSFPLKRRRSEVAAFLSDSRINPGVRSKSRGDLYSFSENFPIWSAGCCWAIAKGVKEEFLEQMDCGFLRLSAAAVWKPIRLRWVCAGPLCPSPLAEEAAFLNRVKTKDRSANGRQIYRLSAKQSDMRLRQRSHNCGDVGSQLAEGSSGRCRQWHCAEGGRARLEKNPPAAVQLLGDLTCLFPLAPVRGKLSAFS